MSGGTVFRNIARLVAPSSVAYCHVSSKPQVGLSIASHAQIPASSSLSVSTFPPNQSIMESRHVELEDWENLTDEEWLDPHRSSDRVVFAPVPTEEEVEEATTDLQATLYLGQLSNSDSLQGGCSGNSASLMLENPGGHTEDLDEVHSIKEAPLPVVKSQPLSLQHGIIFAGQSSAVYQAFRMLQTNPEVQGVVKSLACDPAVWKAVLNNEKVQEFRQYLQEKKEMSDFPKLNATNYEGGAYNLDSGLKIFTIMFNHMTGFLSQVMNKIVLIVSSMFEPIDKTFFGKKGGADGGPIDQVVASCMMLTVAVLIVVLVNRAVAPA